MTQSYRHLLTSSDDLHVSRTLACALGLNTSIFVRRVQEWLEYNEKHKQDKALTHFRDGRWWSFNTYAGWVEDIKVFSLSTMRRAIGHAEALGIALSTDAYNKHSNDGTKWYSIDYEVFDDFMALWNQCGQPNGNRLDADYKELLSKWENYRAIRVLIGLSKLGISAVQDEQPNPVPAVQDEQPNPVPAAQDEQSITRGVFSVESSHTVESTGESRARAITTEEAQRILDAPTHMRRFELQAMQYHPIIDAYSEAVGATHIASEVEKIAALRAQIAGYTPDDVTGLTLEKLAEAKAAGEPFKYPFSWMVNDLSAYKAKQKDRERRAKAFAAASDNQVSDPPVETLTAPSLPANDPHLDSDVFQDSLTKTPRQVWSAFLSQVQLQVDQNAYDVWFHDLQPVDFHQAEGRYTVVARNDLAVQNLRHVYHRTTNRVLRDIAGMPLLVDYLTVDQWKGMQ